LGYERVGDATRRKDALKSRKKKERTVHHPTGNVREIRLGGNREEGMGSIPTSPVHAIISTQKVGGGGETCSGKRKRKKKLTETPRFRLLSVKKVVQVGGNWRERTAQGGKA